MNEVFFKKSFILLTAVVLIVSGFLMFANYQIAQASVVTVTDSAGLVAAGIDSSVTRITLGSNITLGADLVLSNSTKTVDLYGYSLTVAGYHITASSNNSILTNSSSTVSNIPDAAILDGAGQDFTVTHIDFSGTLGTANTSPLDHNISFTFGSVVGVITSTNPAKTFNSIALTSAAGITPGTGTTFYWLTITGAVTASNAVTYDHVTFNGAVTVSTNVSIFSFCIFNAAVINSSGNSIYRQPDNSGGTTFNGPLTNLAGNADYVGARFNGSVTNTAGDANYIGAIFNGAVTNTTGNAKYDGATFSSISGPLTINAGSADTDSAPTFQVAIFSSTNNTAYIPFSLTTPADDGVTNHLTGGGATNSYVNVDVANGTESVVITATTTSGQTITLTGVYPGSLDDSKNVIVTGTTLNPIYTVNTKTPGADVSNGGNKTFTINVHQVGKSDIAYTVNVQVAPTSFTPATNSDTANTNLVLGLVGTSATSSDATIATADTTTNADFITITSVGEGTATITVTAANGNQMTIAVTVAADGNITATPSKWTATTNYTTANPGTLGITATTATSSAASIVTADLTSHAGYVTITSVALGTAVITLTADNGNQAIINVSVAANGSFSYEPTAWTAKTNSSTANTDEILGLIGTTAVSSNTAIATTSISGGNIAITSVGVGTTTITVSDGVNDATIAVTVDALGAITIGTITPYSPPALSSDASLILVAEQSITATGTGTQGSPKIASISVANTVHAIYVEDVGAATSATSSLYSDSSFTTTARPLVLAVGDTHAYIKVVAEDSTEAYYNVTITRAAETTYEVTDGTMTRVLGDTTSTVGIATSPVAAGATVTLTVAPKTGMQLQAGTLAATYNGTATTTLTSTGTNTYTFTMPAYAVTVTATFVAITCPFVSNASTYNAYPTCGAATCNSGYVLSNDICVASGGGGGGGNVTPACTDIVYGDYSTACFGGYQYRFAASRTPSNCALTAAQQETAKRVCSTPVDINNVNVNSNEPPATPPTIALMTCNICQKLTYDVYIINPDESERHTGTPWVRVTDRGNGIKRYSFEDKTLNPQDPNYDYNDFVIDVDFKNCQSVKFMFVSSDAAWKHQVRVKVLVNGVKQSDTLMADNSKAVVGTFKTVNAAGGVDTRSVCPAEPAAFASSLKGKILLQVQAHGEAWYVNPLDGQRYYLANGDKAYDVMRNFGIGITNKNLEKIKSSKTFAKNNSGKIFLQVESRGEAYYIDFNGIAHYLKDGAAAYEVMGSLGLGITNSNLDKITEGNL